MNKSTEVNLIKKYGEARYRQLRSFVGSRMGAMSATKIHEAAVADGYDGFTTWHCRWIGANLNMSFTLIEKNLSWTAEEAEAISEARLMTKVFAATH